MTFLQEVAERIIKQHGNKLEAITLILPSQRALVFLKKNIVKIMDNQAIIAPEMLTIEDWIEKITKLKRCNAFEALVMLYQAYKTVMPQGDNFERFMNWGPPLLKDFEEVASFKADAKALFTNIKDIIDLQKWSPDKPENQSLSQKYLTFYENLYPIYQQFEILQQEKELATRGLMLKKASLQLGAYLHQQPSTDYYFIGFNALSESERILFKTTSNAKKAHFLADADAYYLHNPHQEAGRFLRQLNDEGIYKSSDFKQVQKALAHNPKKVVHHKAPAKHIQGNIANKILSELLNRGIAPEKIALVLIDESLLFPLLGSLPNNLQDLNITMGLPLSELPLFQWVMTYIRLWESNKPKAKSLYYQDVERLLTQTASQLFFAPKNLNNLLAYIRENNLIRVPQKTITEFLGNAEIFTLEQEDQLIDKLLQIFLPLRDHAGPADIMQSEQIFLLCSVFEKLKADIQWLPEEELSIKAYKKLFLAAAAEQKLDLRGEPLKGIQLMGMLETRLLDFPYLIMLSVNEDLLPAARKYQSLIPHDVAMHFNLPDYSYQNAIYAYHFWRLLQRSEEAHFISFADAQNASGPSRFLLQMEWELSPLNPQLQFAEITHEQPATAGLWDGILRPLKTEAFQKSVIELFAKGLSPSSLSNLLYYPEAFYIQKLLKIRPDEEVQEVAGYDVLGNVAHQVLENLYQPYVGKFFPNQSQLNAMKNDLRIKVIEAFETLLPNAEMTHGANVIKLQVAEFFIENQIKIDIERLQNDSKMAQTVLIGLEEKFEITLPFEIEGHPVRFTGNIDRLEQTYEGLYHIIDYKTGSAQLSDVRIAKDIDFFNEKKNLSKVLQLLSYAMMLKLDGRYTGEYLASIAPLKKPSQGLLTLELENETIINSERISFTLEKVKEICEFLFYTDPNAYFNPDSAIENNQEDSD